MWHNTLMYLHNLMMTMILVTVMPLMLSSDTPIQMWFIMEISNIIFAMIIIIKSTCYPTIMMMMLIQAASSSMILMSLIHTSTIPMTVGILIKLGMFPAHPWIPLFMMNIPWDICAMFMTVMKIPPFIIVINTAMDNIMIIISSTITPLVCVIKLIKVNSNKLIMSLSSIIHSSWMMLTSKINAFTWMMYMTLYSINTLSLCSLLNSSHKLNTKNSQNYNIMLTFMMISMMGVPPLTSFLMKLWVIEIMNPNYLLTLMVLVLSSTMSIMFYTRLYNKSIYMNTMTPKSNNVHKTVSTPAMMMIMMNLTCLYLLM